MFPSNSGDDHELSSFQIDGPTPQEDNSSNIADHDHEEQNQGDLALNNELLAAFYWHTTNNNSTNPHTFVDDKKKGKSKCNSSSGAHSSNSILKPSHDDDSEDLYTKKQLHRETERQRRLDMSELYSNLQTLLPPEYVEGKRSVSDHISGSVSYIKHMKRNITDLQDKRDCLIKASRQENSWTDFELVVHPNGAGYELHIRVPTKAHGFSTCIALQVILQQGLDVLTHSSSRVNQEFIHTILCQARDENTSIDINGPRLQQQIYDACQLNCM